MSSDLLSVYKGPDVIDKIDPGIFFDLYQEIIKVNVRDQPPDWTCFASVW